MQQSRNKRVGSACKSTPGLLMPNVLCLLLPSTKHRMVLIRPEKPADHDAVRRVIVDAFTDCQFGHNGEADLVDLVRSNCDDLLALVATDRDTIVGHVLFSPVSVRTVSSVRQGMGLAPMAVVPSRQQAGIGTALVESGIKQLIANGCPFVVVLGHPSYYPRFGFQPASQHRLSHGFDGIPQDVFFVNILDQNVVQSIANGTAIYQPEFGPQQDGTEQNDAREPD